MMYQFLGLRSCHLSGYIRALCLVRGELMIVELPEEELIHLYSALDYMRRNDELV